MTTNVTAPGPAVSADSALARLVDELTARLRSGETADPEATELGLHVLVELHDAEQLPRVLDCGAVLVGVNNRDLRTFNVDRELAIRLRPSIPPDRIVVAESGIRNAADVARLREAGVDAILVGETLMRAPDPEAAVRELARSEEPTQA